MSLELDVKPEQLVELSKKDPESEPLTLKQAKHLADLRFTFSATAKKPLAEAGEKDMVGAGLSIGIGDSELAEYRVVDEMAYYRLDVKKFGELIGFPTPSAEDIDALVPEDESKGIKAVLTGGWVKLDTKELKEAGEAGGAAKDEKKADKAEKKLLDGLRKLFDREITIKDKGSRDGAQHLVATGPVRTLLTGMVDKLRTYAKDMPGGSDGLPTDEDLKGLPNKKISIDFAVKNGELAGATTDLAPLIDDLKKGEKFGLSVTFGEGNKITAPSGATQIHLEDLAAGFGFGPFGRTGEPGDPEDVGYDEFSDEDLDYEEFADEDLGYDDLSDEGV
ncbi:hypothetical protein LRS74_13685 [Streptomyces sp. LX-29]|uniref:hypothetical protein n=1 Tax=Streptomyces sp. LX-29 TaxID=2900152 RepID=UPI00240E36E6|nr:hypothetical protein [Streptomyces sp. LX-29]WFB07989.1 hypothetical protein LRS74_13685 [Streptomyces sp. LX-29]